MHTGTHTGTLSVWPRLLMTVGLSELLWFTGVHGGQARGGWGWGWGVAAGVAIWRKTNLLRGEVGAGFLREA